MKDSDKVGSKFYIWFLAILFIASLVFNIVLIKKSDHGEIAIDSLSKKNAEIVQKLKTAKNELNKFKGVSAKMDEIINEANAKLEEKEKKIRAVLNDKKSLEADNQKLIQEIESIKEKYVDAIDSLFVARQLNKSLNNTIDLMYNKIEDLTTKLGYASRLNVEGLTVTPLKKSFANKEMQTALSKRTQKIKICFDVMDNKVADPGMKDIYIRILTPEAEVLTETETPLTFNHPELKQSVVYTMV